MTTFALVHGAWGSGWHWAALPDELRTLGHAVVAPDLPCEDNDATFEDYAAVVLDALGQTADDDVVVVGFSLGGHTAALVAAARPVRELAYLAALVPEPGVSLSDQFARGDRMLLSEYTAGLERTDDGSTWVDFDVYYRTTCHDCDESVARERFERSRRQSNRPHRSPCALSAHANVRTRYILCSEDGIIVNSFWRDAARRRLGIEPEELTGSHSPMASRPHELALKLASDVSATASRGAPPT